MTAERARQPADFSAAVFATSIIGLLDAIRVAQLPEHAGAGSMRTLLAVLLAYGALGVVAGLVAIAGRKGAPLSHRALAAVPGTFLAASSLAKNGATPRVLAYAALGVVVYAIAVRIFRRAPELTEPAAWWKMHALVLGSAVALGLPSDREGFLVGSLALAASALLLIASFKKPLLATFASVVPIVTAGWLAGHHPRDVASRPAEGPSVLLVTFDTLRADHVGSYGYAGARSKVIDQLGSEGVVFSTAITHSPFTGPSHLSMLTGRLPTNLEVMINEVPLPKSQRTLADWLRKEGYLTAAFVSGWPVIDEVLEIGDRFHTYGDDLREFTIFPETAREVGLLALLDRIFIEREFRQTVPDRRAELTARDAIAWLDRNAGSPFFVWVHFYDPHLPYEPPARYVERATRAYTGPATGSWYGLDAGRKAEIIQDPASMKHMSELYDAEIAHADEQLGRVVEAARRSAPEGLMILVTSDHGESFGEHHLFFGRDLYDPTTRVPLIVVPTEKPAVKRVEAQVKLTDLAPTILDALEIRPYDPMDGRSLLPFIRGSTLAESGPAFSFKTGEAREYLQSSYSIRHHGLKLIRRDEGFADQERWLPGFEELYDLQLDPREVSNRIFDRRSDRDRLDSLLAPQIPARSVLRLDLSPEELEKLRSLGYMD